VDSVYQLTKLAQLIVAW